MTLLLEILGGRLELLTRLRALRLWLESLSPNLAALMVSLALLTRLSLLVGSGLGPYAPIH